MCICQGKKQYFLFSCSAKVRLFTNCYYIWILQQSCFHLDMYKGRVNEGFVNSNCRLKRSYNRFRDKQRRWEYFSTGLIVQLLTRSLKILVVALMYGPNKPLFCNCLLKMKGNEEIQLYFCGVYLFLILSLSSFSYECRISQA